MNRRQLLKMNSLALAGGTLAAVRGAMAPVVGGALLPALAQADLANHGGSK